MLYGAALALAFEGDAGGAQTLSDKLGKLFPEDTLVKLKYLPTIHAQLALNRGDSSNAIDTLRVAAPYELGLPSRLVFFAYSVSGLCAGESVFGRASRQRSRG